jgi:phage terminase large subunit
MLSKKKYIAYGGARGGGKSWAARIKGSLLALRYSNLKVLLLRRTFPELEANHIIPLQIMLKGIAEYVVSKKMFIFPNGSFIKLGYCKNEHDAFQYQGHEYDVIIFEEATLFTEAQLTFISTCARNVRVDFTPRIYYTCNPGGVGHHYIKRLFIDREYTATENPDEYEFIPASVYDNEVLMERDPSYITVLDNLPEELRKAHRDGDWDALSGQYFREFKRSLHVIAPFQIPKSWKRYVTMDYGLDRCAAYFIAVDYNGFCYVYRELYEKDLIVSEAAKKIRYLAQGEDITYFYMPPDLGGRRQETGKSALLLFQEAGVTGVISKNDRVAGWLCLKEYLKGENPKLKIFENCRNLIKYIPMLQRDEKNPNDIATEPHEATHGPDALRYFCSTFVKSPLPEEELGLRGTYFLAELYMKGFNRIQIRAMEKRGQIRIIA